MAKLRKELEKELIRCQGLAFASIATLIIVAVIISHAGFLNSKQLKDCRELNESLPQQLNNTCLNCYQAGLGKGQASWNQEVYNSLYGFGEIPFIRNDGKITLVKLEGVCQNYVENN